MRDFNDFRAHVFSEMAEILKNSRCSNYKILGYSHLTQRLIMYYRDCIEVHEWDFFVDFDDKTKEGEITHKKFFTKNYVDHDEYLIEVKRFGEDFNRETEEEK